MLEISGFIADCFNNGDLLEKFTLRFDKDFVLNHSPFTGK